MRLLRNGRRGYAGGVCCAALRRRTGSACAAAFHLPLCGFLFVGGSIPAAPGLRDGAADAAKRSSAAECFAAGVLLSAGLRVQAVEMLLCQTKIPTVLDADGINCIAAHKDILKTVQAPLVLTPHPGEMARLTGMTTAQVQASRPTLAAEFAAEYGVVLVLKGHHTVIAAPDGRQWVNPTGNAGMARGGSGDLLAGMIAAFLAQGLSAEDAAVLGVWLHGAAGDICAQKHSRTAMQPHELLNVLPELFLNLEKQD